MEAIGGGCGIVDRTPGTPDSCCLPDRKAGIGRKMWKIILKHANYSDRFFAFPIVRDKFIYYAVPINRFVLQSTSVNSYPDYSDLRLIRMYLRPTFRQDQSNTIPLIRISHHSYYFIRSLAIRIRRIQLYLLRDFM